MGMIHKTCKETSMLVTQSLDRRLTWSERMSMGIHLAICDNCARFMRQMHALRTWLSTEDESTQPGLSEESRERISQKLREGE